MTPIYDAFVAGDTVKIVSKLCSFHVTLVCIFFICRFRTIGMLATNSIEIDTEYVLPQCVRRQTKGRVSTTTKGEVTFQQQLIRVLHRLFLLHFIDPIMKTLFFVWGICTIRFTIFQPADVIGDQFATVSLFAKRSLTRPLRQTRRRSVSYVRCDVDHHTHNRVLLCTHARENKNGAEKEETAQWVNSLFILSLERISTTFSSIFWSIDAHLAYVDG